MPPVLPNSREAMIQWFAQRITTWAATPTAIGLTAAQMATLATKLNTAGNHENAAFAARIASKSATVNYYNSSDDLRNFGSDLIKTIKAFAETTNNPAVYALANVPPPAAPAPLGPPATPTALVATLDTAGQIAVKWEGSRVGGTSFTIERSLSGATGPWSIVGVSEERSFLDVAVPRGVDAISYRVTASRAGGSSTPSASVSVLFGNTGSQNNSASGNNGLSLAA